MTPLTEATAGRLIAAIGELMLRLDADQRKGPRDQADAALLLAIAEAVQDRRFTAAELVRHATADPALHAAIRGTDTTTVKELGKLLARLAGRSSAGLLLERVGAGRAGIIWRVRVLQV